MGREKDEAKTGLEEESNEAWKQALEAFKEQALKMQSVSQEAYEIYSQKAMVTLKETSEQLKIQAEKAKKDLTQVAKEISEEGKVYLSTAAENSPPEVKEIVETYSSSADEFNDVSKVLDFHVGIPYGIVFHIGIFIFIFWGAIHLFYTNYISLSSNLCSIQDHLFDSYKISTFNLCWKRYFLDQNGRFQID